MEQKLKGHQRQMTRPYGMGTVVQIAAVPIAFALPRVAVAITLLCVPYFLLPQPYKSERGSGPDENPDRTHI